MSDQPVRNRPRHVVILAHPDRHSFNATVAETYCETVRSCGQDVIVRDLYAMGFDPILKDAERPTKPAGPLSADVRTELDAIRGADIYTLVYPVWFAMPPAMMKGYIDRVLGAGVTAKDIQSRASEGVLNGRHMLSISTSGAREIWLDEQAQVESMRNVFTRYLFHAFAMASCEHLHLGGIVEGFSKRFIDQNLQDVHERARKVCAMLSAEHHRGLALASIGDGS